MYEVSWFGRCVMEWSTSCCWNVFPAVILINCDFSPGQGQPWLKIWKFAYKILCSTQNKMWLLHSMWLFCPEENEECFKHCFSTCYPINYANRLTAQAHRKKKKASCTAPFKNHLSLTCKRIRALISPDLFNSFNKSLSFILKRCMACNKGIYHYPHSLSQICCQQDAGGLMCSLRAVQRGKLLVHSSKCLW